MSNQDMRAAWTNAQMGCIGSVLHDPDLTGQLLTETSPEDFDGPALTVYQAMGHLFAEGYKADPILLAERLPGNELTQYVLEVMDMVPTSALLPDYIRAVRRRSRLSQIRSLALQLAAAEDLDTAGGISGQIQTALTTDRGSRTESMEQAMTRVLDELRQGHTYIPTGLSVLDSRVYMSPGDYVVLAGRPSAGKSALAIQFALSMARTRRVGFYSLEGAKKAPERALIQLSRIPGEDIRLGHLTDKQWEVVAEASMTLCQYYGGLKFTNAAGWTVDQIFREAVKEQQSVIFIDYLQLCQASGSGRYEVVTNISERIHTLAQLHGILVIALSQFNRESDRSAEPSMADLRESGQIEQDADAILLLYLKDKKQTGGPRNLKVAKNKEGVTGLIELAFDGSILRFTALSHRQAPPAPRYREYKPLPADTKVPAQWEGEQTKMEV